MRSRGYIWTTSLRVHITATQALEWLRCISSPPVYKTQPETFLYPLLLLPYLPSLCRLSNKSESAKTKRMTQSGHHISPNLETLWVFLIASLIKAILDLNKNNKKYLTWAYELSRQTALCKFKHDVLYQMLSNLKAAMCHLSKSYSGQIRAAYHQAECMTD